MTRISRFLKLLWVKVLECMCFFLRFIYRVVHHVTVQYNLEEMLLSQQKTACFWYVCVEFHRNNLQHSTRNSCRFLYETKFIENRKKEQNSLNQFESHLYPVWSAFRILVNVEDIVPFGYGKLPVSLGKTDLYESRSIEIVCSVCITCWYW